MCESGPETGMRRKAMFGEMEEERRIIGATFFILASHIKSRETKLKLGK